ncbi:MAG: tetratricopeptide repeat protein, partial [Gemmatimonadetes bacterium]|nr:tetratricopeptide repeat protein [Gemmatimonadota bacterium]
SALREGISVVLAPSLGCIPLFGRWLNGSDRALSTLLDNRVMSKLSVFLTELRRRKVGRVAALYAAVGVTISLAAAELYDVLLLPAWTPRLIIFLLVLGFPVALLLAWAYEVAPEKGVEVPTAPVRGDLREEVDETEGLQAVADSTAAGRSIVVLPFLDMSPSADQEYFSDGLAEDVINALTHIKDFRVAARTSAFSFKGEQIDAREIGRKLSVSTVLEGSVQRVGDRLRVTAQLIDAQEGYHLWSEQYDRVMADVFSIQDEITAAIVEAMKIELLDRERSAVSKRYTENLDAYQLYLKGRHHWNRSTTDGYWKAIDLFQEAIRTDPSYALAYTGLADAYASLGDAGHSAVSPKEAFSAARAATMKALELDEGLSEAHATLGHLMMHEFAWSDAEKEFRRAIELNPNYATAYRFLAGFFAAVGRSREAIVTLEKALDLDPVCLGTLTDLGVIHYFAREYDQAIAHYQEVLEMAPEFARAHVTLSSAYVKKGLYAEAIGEIERAMEISGDRGKLAALGRAYAAAGRKDEAAQVVDELKDLSKERYVTPYAFTLIYASMGEKDEAMTWLRQACDQGVSDLIYLKVDPFLDGLRDDPRFALLLNKIGMEEACG